jgi:predicted nucleic acid-binding protein
VKKVVIADAGPLIALARINQLGLLARLFGTVTVTSPVVAEVLAGGDFPDTAALAQALTEPWLETFDFPDTWLDECKDWVQLHQIDMGEASALVLAQHCNAQGQSALLVMDDFRGRNAAQHGGIALIGTTGLLLLAKQAGAVDAVKPLLRALRQQGYFLSDGLIEVALTQAGEVVDAG